MNINTAAAVEAWEMTAEADRVCDPLLGCLIHVTGSLGRPWSSDALTAGLPVHSQGLTPDLFVRSAARAGLSAKIVRRPLAEISSLTLPAVILLKDRNACVLVAKDEHSERLQVMHPESGGSSDVGLTELGD